MYCMSQNYVLIYFMEHISITFLYVWCRKQLLTFLILKLNLWLMKSHPNILAEQETCSLHVSMYQNI